MNSRNWYVFQKQNQLKSSKRHETQMTNKLAVRVFKQVSDEMIMRSWGHKLLQYQIIICIPSRTMSSDNSDDDDNNNDDNHGVPTSSRDRLGGKGSFDNNDNYTDRHWCENWLPSLVPRMNKRQEQMRVEKWVRDLEYDLRQLDAENKQLKVELKCSKKKTDIWVRRIPEPIMNGHLARQTWPTK